MDMYSDGAANSDERTRFRLFSIPLLEAGIRVRYKRFQSSCYNFLERPCGPLSRSYHFAIFCLVIVGLVLAVLLTVNETNHDLNLGIFILEMFLLIIFTLEYTLRMWSAGCRSTYVGFLGRVRFGLKPFVILDLVIIGSTFAVIVASAKTDFSSSIRILRFFQVLRMVRFDRQGGSWKLLGSVLYLHRQELLTTFYIGFCSLIFASFFVYLAEKVENKGEFGNLADSFWWGVATLTTVGYGDKVPRTWAGRGVATFFAIMGISFFALPAGILGSGFALKVSQQQRQKHAKRRRRPAAVLIQCNWRYYASRKHSTLEATWSPYIKYLQERYSRKQEVKEVDSNSEKQSQFAGPRRKISIFGRKHSDGFCKPESSAIIPDYFKSRSKKILEHDPFPSIESLHNAPSVSTVDQRTDDEHGGNTEVQNPIIVRDSDGNWSLPSAYKQGIRFTRYLKLLVALRKFKLAKRPYDVKDVIEQYSTGHVELLGKVKGIGHKIDEALGYRVGTEKINENPANARTNVVYRLTKLEKQVKALDFKLDRVISLMETSGKKDQPVIKTWSIEDNMSTWKSSEERYPSMVVQSKTVGLKPASRMRKVAAHNSYPRVNEPRDSSYKNHEPGNRGVNSLFTTEDFNHSLNLSQTEPNNNNDRKSGRKDGPDQSFDENHLSPKPFGGESYDLRSRSDSAISSVSFDQRKACDGNSLAISPTSSDSEFTSSIGTVTEQLCDKSNDLGTSNDSSLHVNDTPMQETTM